MKIKNKLIILFLTITLIPLVFVGMMAFSNTQLALSQATLEKLNSLAESKEAELLGYIEAKKGRTLDFASDGFLRSEAEKLASGVAGQTLNQYLKVEKQLLDRDITEILILNNQNTVLAATHQEDVGEIVPASEANEHRFGTHVHGVSVVHGLPTLTLDTPLISVGGASAIGTLIVRFNLGNIREVLSGEYALQSGAKTTLAFPGTMGIYLVDQEGLLLFSINKMEEVNFQKQKITTPAVRLCLEKGQEINASSQDYIGKAVLTASMCPQISPDIRWALVVEQDQTEALRPVINMQKVSGIIIIMTSLIVALLAVVTSRSITDPIEKLTRLTNDISRGQMETKLEEGVMESKDEIGDLARAFDRIIVSLKLAMRGKEEKPNA